ncbi:MAG: ArsR family transcriptional regulator [Lachnospiraceae bacterium]|nr:ArsR family transcriptional regulator [Lachnospiraceae bacterium]
MLRVIAREVNYIFESVALLRHLGSEKKYAELRETLNKKYVNPFKEGLRKLELLEQIEQCVEKTFLKNMEEIKYYFKIHDDAQLSSAGELALLWEDSMNMEFKDVTEYGKYLRELSEKEYCKKFGECLQSFTNLIQDKRTVPKTEEPFAVISALMKMDVKEEEKWKLQKIFVDRKEHQEKVLALLERTVEILKSFEEELLELTEQFYRYWTKELQGNSLTAYIRERAEIDVGESTLGFCLYPSIFSPNVISLRTETEEDGTYKQPDIVRFGILFGEDFDIRSSRTHEDDGYENYVTQVLKLLGDKSKFEILSYVRDKEAYGSELAKHLNLTTATVSHHMNALLVVGLVELKRVDNRIYYSANKKALEEVLDYSKKILLGC